MVPLINYQLTENFTWRYRPWKWLYIRYIACAVVVLDVGNEDRSLTDALQEEARRPQWNSARDFSAAILSFQSTAPSTPPPEWLIQAETLRIIVNFSLVLFSHSQSIRHSGGFTSKLNLESTHFTPCLIIHCNSLFLILWASISTQWALMITLRRKPFFNYFIYF